METICRLTLEFCVGAAVGSLIGFQYRNVISRTVEEFCAFPGSLDLKDVRATENVHFNPYRGTLCISAVFATTAVNQSDTLVYCMHMAEDIVKLLSRPGSYIILVFDAKRRYQILREPLQRGLKYTGVGKIRFPTEIALYLGNGTRRMVVTEC